MEDGQDFDGSRQNVIIDDVWSCGDRQYPNIGFSGLPPHEREFAQAQDGGLDLFSHTSCSTGFVWRDERADLLQVADSARVPFYSHSGGGTSRPTPHVSSHDMTGSLRMVFPTREASRRRASST